MSFRLRYSVPILLVLGACAHVPSVEPRHIDGRVVAADTGRPLSGAEITISYAEIGSTWAGSSTNRWFMVIADLDGRFQLDRSLDRRVNMRIRKDNYRGSFDRSFPPSNRLEALILRVSPTDGNERGEPPVGPENHPAPQELRKLGHKFPDPT